MSKTFTLEEIASIVDLKEGEDPTTNVEQALNIATRLKILKSYAQNGNQYQLRWTAQDAPLSIPRGSVCSFICQRMIEKFGNPDMLDPNTNGNGDPDDVPAPIKDPVKPPKPAKPKEPISPQPDPEKAEEEEQELVPATVDKEEQQEAPAPAMAGGMAETTRDPLDDHSHSMHEFDGPAVVGANIGVDSTIEEIAENMTEEEVEAAVVAGTLDPAVAEAMAAKQIPNDALEALAARDAIDAPGVTKEEQDAAEAKVQSDIG